VVTTDVGRSGTGERRTLASETALVVSIAVGLAAARSVLDFASEATAPGGLRAGSATLVGSLAPGQPWIDLGFQVVLLVGLVLPVLLAAHLTRRSGDPLAAIGLRRERWGQGVALGLGIATAIGGLGLVAYLVSRAAGFSVTVVPAALPDVWWRSAVLVFAASLSAGIRGAYHLYQGLAGCLGNLVMGLVFGRFYQRTGTIVPLVVAHAAIDIVAFLGYSELAGHVSWLPVVH
jgi:hypothetical protein